MSYYLEYSGMDHQDMLADTLQHWAKEDQDIYLVTKEGHRVYTSKKLLVMFTSSLSSIICSSTIAGVSLPYSASTISALLSLLSTGQVASVTTGKMEKVQELAICLGIILNLSMDDPLEGETVVVPEETFQISTVNSVEMVACDNEVSDEASCPPPSKKVKLDGSNNEESEAGNIKKENGEQFVCEFCHKNYSKKGNLKQHKQKQHVNERAKNIEPGEKACNYCPLTFKPPYFERHMNTGHPEISGELQTVNESLLEESELDDCDEVDGIIFECDDCELQFDTEDLLDNHQIEHTQDNEDNNTFKPIEKIIVEPDLTNVKKEIHEVKSTEDDAEKKKVFQCEFCSNAYCRKTVLKNHKMEKHPHERVNTTIPGEKSCNFCPSTYKEVYYNRHMKSSHPELVEEHSENTSNESEKDINGDLEVNETITADTDDKEDTAIASSDDIVEKSEEKKIEYQCNQCQKILGSNHALKVHLTTHLEEKPFKCGVCDVGFTQKGNLKVHTEKFHASQEVVPESSIS